MIHHISLIVEKEMKKLYLILFLMLLVCNGQLSAMHTKIIRVGIVLDRQVLDEDRKLTLQAFAFELFCRDHLSAKPQRETVLEYITNPSNDINKHIPGTIVCIDN